MRLGQGEGGNVILSGQPFEEGSRTCFFVQAGQLWTAASLLQMTNHRLPLDPFPSAASGVQSAWLRGSRAAHHKQAHTSMYVSWLSSGHCKNMDSGLEVSWQHCPPRKIPISPLSKVLRTGVRCMLSTIQQSEIHRSSVRGLPSPVAPWVIWHIASECLYLEQDPNQAKLLVA